MLTGAPKNDMNEPATYFYGMQPLWTWVDRLYRIYVSDRALAGAYIGGQVYDETTASLTFQQFTPLLSGWIRKILDRRRERESLYDSINPFSTRFLDIDPLNFWIAREDVIRTRLKRTRTLWTPINSGVVEIEMIDGRVRRFILIGDQEHDDILELMKRFDPSIEAYGRKIPLPRPSSNPRRINRFVYGIFAGVLLCFGLFFTVLAIVDPAKKPRLIATAIMNAIAGTYCLAQSLRPRDESIHHDE